MIRREKRICRLAALVLVAGAWVGYAASSAYAQEASAQRGGSANPNSQQTAPPQPDASVTGDPSHPAKHTASLPKGTHRFWDQENDWLFAGVAASRTFDYFSTLNMRRRGRQEIFLTNDIVDNHAAFAVIEASATAASIGAAYLFHRYGHHKLERWTSIVHIGLASTGAVRNYCLKTAHFAVTPGSP